MPARVQYDPAEECYWQGTFLLQQRGGKEEVNELEYKPDFAFVSSTLVLSRFFQPLPFPCYWKCCKLYNAGLCSTESSHMNSRPEHTQKHTDKLIILKKQRPGAHLAYFPRQHWDVGRGIEFRGGCSCTLGNIQYSKCDAHKHSLCIVNLRPHLPQITSPHVLDYSLWLCNWNPEKIMPKLKEANSRVGFQLSIPVGFYSIMTYSTPSVTLPVTRSAQVEPIDVNIITAKTRVSEWTAIFNHQYFSFTRSSTQMYD